SPEEPRPVKGYKDEVLNAIHQHMRMSLVDRETELRGLLEKDRKLAGEMERLEGEYRALREETARRAFERKQLDLKEGTFTRSYGLLAAKLEQAKIAESEQEGLSDLKIVADAVVPDEKTAPRRSAIVVMAAILGALISCALAVIEHHVRVMRRTPRPAANPAS
ncbi:MAG: hypothetical protein JXR94_04710, partial [Candidatus Hydrogenedentes bacterium]|nr:hypothetical protein [Candidatus Hydrogenedentota bacterium]